MLRFWFVLLLGVGLAAYAQQPAHTLRFTVESPILLKEQKGFYFRSVSEVLRIDTLLWVLTRRPNSVLIFDLQGQPVQRLAPEGGGPGELRLPKRPRCYQDTVWIWDGMGTRFQLFHARQRTFLGTVSGFSVNAHDMVYLPDMQLVVFIHNLKEENFLNLFDLRRQMYLRALGKWAYENAVLSLWDQTLHLAAQGPYVYFAPPAEAALARLDVRTLEIETFPLDVPEFSVAPYKGGPAPYAPEVAPFLFTQSINRGVWRTHLGLMLILETGPYQPTVEGTRVDIIWRKQKKRKVHFVLVDPSTMRQMGHVQWDGAFIHQHKLIGLVGWDPETATFYFYGQREAAPIHQITPVRFYLEPEAH